LPGEFRGANTCADLHVHPSGQFLYGSNRGADGLCVFSIEQSSGRLTYVGDELTQGKTPRNFAIDPTGTFLIAANQDSDSLVSFRIEAQTGRLTPTGRVCDTPTPVCIHFFRAQ
jgi:6-phosphogluconolactonase